MENTNTQQPAAQPNGRANVEDANGEAHEESVSYSAYQQVKNDMHRFKSEAAQKEAELKAVKEREMREKEQWKELFSDKEKEANEWKEKYEARDKAIVMRAKLSAVKEAAIKLGLVESAYDDLENLDFRDVIVETTSTGRVNVIGAKASAEKLKATKPHWFSENRMPNVNPNAPRATVAQGGQSSYAELSKLEEQARKSGDYTEYYKAVKAVKTQR